jgi:hypothetical protein
MFRRGLLAGSPLSSRIEVHGRPGRSPANAEVTLIRTAGSMAGLEYRRKISVLVRSAVMRRAVAVFPCFLFFGALVGQAISASPEAELARKVSRKGWIAYSAHSSRGDWDIFLARPDGSDIRNLTNTPEFSEAAPQFSHDARKLLYRRLRAGEKLDSNRHGEQGALVISNSDGSDPKVLGQAGEYPWASLNPDGSKISCLSIKGIFLIELASMKVLNTFARKGFFQQITWSPDGSWLSGVANSYGTGWSVARMNIATGETNAVNRVDCCTPDWFPDSRNVIFSWRVPGQGTNKGYGWTQLWRADAEGKTPQLVYAEDGRHVYGGHVSPDGLYVLFTGNMQEDGDPMNAGAPMALMRLADAPIIGGESPAVRKLHPEAKNGPVLKLPQGWEPCWTFSEAPGSRAAAAAPSTGHRNR